MLIVASGPQLVHIEIIRFVRLLCISTIFSGREIFPTGARPVSQHDRHVQHHVTGTYISQT
jgi:hypothetical protein